MIYNNLLLLSATAAGILQPVLAAWDPSRPSVFDSFGGVQETDLLNELPSHTDRSVAWTAGWIPKYCYNEAVTKNLSPADFEVRNVYYTDCAAPWAICRHKSSSRDWNYIIDRVGRVPVGQRQYISNLLVFPDTVQTSAYTYGSWYASSYNPAYLTLGVLAHENSHILDVEALKDVIAADGLAEGTAYSSTSHWSGAYNKDSSVPTSYSNTAWAEDFADTGRWWLSDHVHPGGLAAYSIRRSEVANQLGNYRARLESIIFPSSGRCTGKVDTSQAVLMSTGSARRRRGVAPPPPSTLAGTDIPEIEVPQNKTDLHWIYQGPAPGI